MKKTTKNFTFRVAILSIMMVFGMFLSSAYAATITYGALTGNWTDANWTPQAPVAGDDVVIPLGAVVTVSTDLSATGFNSLSVKGVLTIAATGKLSISQTVTVNPLVDLVGGVIQNDGSLSITQTIASNNNYAIKFSDNATIDDSFTNTGILAIDLSKRAAAQTVSCINFMQLAAGRTNKMKFGGTITINVPIQSRIFELGGAAGSVLLDGTYSFGSASDYKDWRFLHMGVAGTVTIASTANIKVYTNYTNTSNGVICMPCPLAGNSFVNNGTFSIYGGSTSAAYGIYMNTQVANAPCTVTNNGTLNVIGTFPKGAIYVAGNATGVNTINNLGASATMSVLHTDPAFAAIKLATTTTPITLKNEGTVNLSTAALDLGTAGVLNNTGTINYNRTTDIKVNNAFADKVYVSGQNIVVNESTEATLQIVDMTGRIMKQVNLKGQNSSVNTGGLKGLFVVRLITSDKIYSQKIIL